MGTGVDRVEALQFMTKWQPAIEKAALNFRGIPGSLVLNLENVNKTGVCVITFLHFDQISEVPSKGAMRQAIASGTITSVFFTTILGNDWTWSTMIPHKHHSNYEGPLVIGDTQSLGFYGECRCGSRSHLKHCKGCNHTLYCSKACSEKFWGDHKRKCKEISKARAELGT